jgi:hypothetical protein
LRRSNPTPMPRIIEEHDIVAFFSKRGDPLFYFRYSEGPFLQDSNLRGDAQLLSNRREGFLHPRKVCCRTLLDVV